MTTRRLGRGLAPARLSSSRSRRFARRGSEAFGIIEVIVALGVLMAILVPLTILIYNGQTAATQVRLRAEATDLASEAIQKALNSAAYGVAIDTGPHDLGTETVGTNGDPFHVQLNYDIGYQNQAGQICTNPTNGDSNERSDIFSVSAIISWNHGQGLSGQVIQTTNLAPPAGEFPSPDATEIAVPINGPDGLPIDTAIKVELSCELANNQPGSCAAQALPGYVVSGDAATENGYAVFTDAWAGSDVEYAVQVANNDGYVSSDQLSDAPTAAGLPTEGGIIPVSDGVAVAPPIQMALGTNASVAFTSYWQPTASALPIVVSGDVTEPGQSWPLGEPSAIPGHQSFDTTPGNSTEALLYPAGSYEVFAGDLPASGGNPSPEDPATYGDNDEATIDTTNTTALVETPDSTAPGLPLYPLELDITGSSTPLSSITATVSGDPTVNPNGSGWPQVALNTSCERDPDWQDGVSPAGPSGPVGAQPTTTSSPGTTTSSTATTTSSTSTSIAGSTTSTTNPTGPIGSPGWSCTGVPLGQYQLSVAGGSGSNTLDDPYVWVTPYGACASSNPMSVVPDDASTCTSITTGDSGAWYHNTAVPEAYS